MRTINLIAGLVILQSYRENQDGHDFGAEHDVLYAYPTDKPVKENHIVELIEMGWRQEPEVSSGFSLEDYNQLESWVAYE